MKLTVGEIYNKRNSIKRFITIAGLPAEEGWNVADFYDELEKILMNYAKSTEMLIKNIGKKDPKKTDVYYIDEKEDPEKMKKYKEEDAKLRAKEFEFDFEPIPVKQITFTQPITPIDLKNLEGIFIKREKKQNVNQKI